MRRIYCDALAVSLTAFESLAGGLTDFLYQAS
jgi:hypothetical protein